METTIDAKHDLLSLGKLCEIFQQSPARIERALSAAGLAAALRLNGIAYFDQSAVDAIRTFFNNDSET